MENKTYTHSIKNIPTRERIVFGVLGTYLLYRAAKNHSTIFAISGSIAALRGIIGYCPFYDMMGKKEARRHNINIRTRMVVNKPVDEVYKSWRQLSNLPIFMGHLERVTETGAVSSNWKVKIPGHLGTVSWDAVIVNEKENEVLGWTSVAGAPINNSGKIEFTSIGPFTTELDIVISYRAPLGTLGENIARLFSSSFEKMITEDILSFRDYIENGFVKNQG